LVQVLDPRQFFNGRPSLDIGWDFINDTELDEFTETAIGGGDSVALVTGEPNGAALFQGAATTDNSGAQIQHPGSILTLDANGVYSWRHCSKLSAIAGEWKAGLAKLDTTYVAGVSDEVSLHKVEDTGEVFLMVTRDSNTVQDSLGVIAGASAYEVWGIQIRKSAVAQAAVIQAYLNGLVVWEDEYTDVPDDEVLTVSYGFQSGSASGTQSVKLDYMQLRGTRYIA
jgi:hypothetical protein